jgi:hypothetical protein
LAIAATTAFSDDMPPFTITNKARTVAHSDQGMSLDPGAFAEDSVLLGDEDSLLFSPRHERENEPLRMK